MSEKRTPESLERSRMSERRRVEDEIKTDPKPIAAVEDVTGAIAPLGRTPDGVTNVIPQRLGPLDPKRDPPPDWKGTYACCGACGRFLGTIQVCPDCVQTAPVGVVPPPKMIA